MSTSHTWFATKNDAELVIAWLRTSGSKPGVRRVT